jgi:hypothetical protein
MAASKKQVRQAQEMAAAGKSAAQIARKTGVSGDKAGRLASQSGPASASPYADGVTYQLNDAGTAPVQSFPYVDGVTYQMNDEGTAPIGQYNNGTLEALSSQNEGSSKKTLRDAGGVGEALRIAGANGNLSKKELLKISEYQDKGTDRIVRRLDEVNDKRAGKNKAPIGLGHGAYNSLLKTPTSRTIFGKTMSELGLKDRYNDYGNGPIGRAIRQGKGTSDYYGNSVKGTGKIPKGQQVFGSYNDAPQVQIKPQNNVNAGYYGAGPGTGGNSGGNGVSTNPTPSPTPSPTPTTTQVDPTKDDASGYSSGTYSGVDGGATSFRRKKSSGRQSGLTNRGPSQFRNSLKVGSASGINLGM